MAIFAKFRLLPVAIFAAVLLLTVKAGTMWSDFDDVMANISVAESKAQEQPPEPPDADSDLRGFEPVEGADTDAAATDLMDDPVATTAVEDLFDPMALNATEFALLQDLATRRESLDDRDRELDLREKMLLAAERQVDGKIAELKEIEKPISKLLEQYDEEQAARIDSLVKIYQNMKPKDAARIFAELDTDVLLDVLGRMREAKTAPILALMDPNRAQTLTIELAERGRLPETAASRY